MAFTRDQVTKNLLKPNWDLYEIDYIKNLNFSLNFWIWRTFFGFQLHCFFLCFFLSERFSHRTLILSSEICNLKVTLNGALHLLSQSHSFSSATLGPIPLIHELVNVHFIASTSIKFLRFIVLLSWFMTLIIWWSHLNYWLK